jgi:hypothetical protein
MVAHMSIQRNFAFPKPGQPPPGDLDSADALAGLTTSRDSANDYNRARAAATGEQGGGSAGFELEPGELQTTGSVGDAEEFGETTGGTDQLVTRDDVGVSNDSNMH